MKVTENIKPKKQQMTEGTLQASGHKDTSIYALYACTSLNLANIAPNYVLFFLY